MIAPDGSPPNIQGIKMEILAKMTCNFDDIKGDDSSSICVPKRLESITDDVSPDGFMMFTITPADDHDYDKLELTVSIYIQLFILCY